MRWQGGGTHLAENLGQETVRFSEKSYFITPQLLAIKYTDIIKKRNVKTPLQILLTLDCTGTWISLIKQFLSLARMNINDENGWQANSPTTLLSRSQGVLSWQTNSPSP